MPVIIDIIKRRGVGENNNKIMDWLIHLGFKKYKKYLSMQYIRQEGETLDYLLSNVYIDRGDYLVNDIYNIWNNNLDKYITNVPSLEQIDGMVKSKEIYAICNELQELCSVLHCNKKNSKSIIQHVTTVTKYRRQGLAKILVKYVICYAEPKNRLFELWVDDANIAARNLYESIGFRYTGFESLQYLCN